MALAHPTPLSLNAEQQRWRVLTASALILCIINSLIKFSLLSSESFAVVFTNFAAIALGIAFQVFVFGYKLYPGQSIFRAAATAENKAIVFGIAMKPQAEQDSFLKRFGKAWRQSLLAGIGIVVVATALYSAFPSFAANLTLGNLALAFAFAAAYRPALLFVPVILSVFALLIASPLHGALGLAVASFGIIELVAFIGLFQRYALATMFLSQRNDDVIRAMGDQWITLGGAALIAAWLGWASTPKPTTDQRKTPKNLPRESPAHNQGAGHLREGARGDNLPTAAQEMAKHSNDRQKESSSEEIASADREGEGQGDSRTAAGESQGAKEPRQAESGAQGASGGTEVSESNGNGRAQRSKSGSGSNEGRAKAEHPKKIAAPRENPKLPKLDIKFDKYVVATVVAAVIALLLWALLRKRMKLPKDNVSKSKNISTADAISTIKLALAQLSRQPPTTAEERRSMVIALYHLLCDFLGSIGCAREEHLTPDEYCWRHRVFSSRPNDDMNFVTKLFCSVLYGHQSPSKEESSHFMAAIDRLCGAKKGDTIA